MHSVTEQKSGLQNIANPQNSALKAKVQCVMSINFSFLNFPKNISPYFFVKHLLQYGADASGLNGQRLGD